MTELDKKSSVKMSRRVSSRLAILRRQLNYRNIDELLLDLISLSCTLCWTESQISEMLENSNVVFNRGVRLTLKKLKEP